MIVYNLYNKLKSGEDVWNNDLSDILKDPKNQFWEKAVIFVFHISGCIKLEQGALSST